MLSLVLSPTTPLLCEHCLCSLPADNLLSTHRKLIQAASTGNRISINSLQQTPVPSYLLQNNCINTAADKRQLQKHGLARNRWQTAPNSPTWTEVMGRSGKQEATRPLRASQFTNYTQYKYATQVISDDNHYVNILWGWVVESLSRPSNLIRSIYRAT